MLSGPSYIPTNPKQVLFLCHGYGANGDDLMGLAPALAAHFPQMAFFAPNGIMPMLGGGYEWFSLHDFVPDRFVSPDFMDDMVHRVKPAADAFKKYFSKTLADLGLSESDAVIAGFSQGGLLAQYTALTLDKPVAGVIGFSSVPLLFKSALPVEMVKQHLPVLLTHGDMDPVVPARALSMSIAELNKAGQKVTSYIAPNLGHGIDGGCVEEAVKFMNAVLP
ncbi:MAG: prolyl oligopeptidase family serine peptidase [Lactobacillales bacterium]|jgi:phospholipase/carboxylesterase|nr:prolyl oligopeptidase family serine peptidase [Lactobacillales bacterium]